MMTAVVLVLLTLCVCFGIRSYAKKLRQGGGCCGGGCHSCGGSCHGCDGSCCHEK